MKEQNPIDEHFKQHLHDAEVKPSSDLWSKMEPRLNDEKDSRKGWWIGIAASLAFGLAVSSWLYDNYQEPSMGPELPIGTEQPSIESPSTPPSELNESIELTAPEYDESESTQSIADQENEPKGEIQAAPSHSRNMADSNSAEERRTMAMNEPEQAESISSTPNTQSSDEDREEVQAREIGVKVRINPSKYLAMAEAQPAEETATPLAQERVEITEYAEAQFNNLIAGEALEAPSKEGIKWPSLSVNLNPLIEKFTPETDNSSTEN